jgi:hypothetical protein
LHADAAAEDNGDYCKGDGDRGGGSRGGNKDNGGDTHTVEASVNNSILKTNLTLEIKILDEL